MVQQSAQRDAVGPGKLILEGEIRAILRPWVHPFAVAVAPDGGACVVAIGGWCFAVNATRGAAEIARAWPLCAGVHAVLLTGADAASCADLEPLLACASTAALPVYGSAAALEAPEILNRARGHDGEGSGFAPWGPPPTPETPVIILEALGVCVSAFTTAPMAGAIAYRFDHNARSIVIGAPQAEVDLALDLAQARYGGAVLEVSMQDGAVSERRW